MSTRSAVVTSEVRTRPVHRRIVLLNRGAEVGLIAELISRAFIRDPEIAAEMAAICSMVGEVDVMTLPLDVAETKIGRAAAVAAKLAIPVLVAMRGGETHRFGLAV